jgi:hypothetical protein
MGKSEFRTEVHSFRLPTLPHVYSKVLLSQGMRGSSEVCLILSYPFALNYSNFRLHLGRQKKKMMMMMMMMTQR